MTPGTYVGMARDLLTFVADFRPGWGENALFLYFSRSKTPWKDPQDSSCRRHRGDGVGIVQLHIVIINRTTIVYLSIFPRALSNNKFCVFLNIYDRCDRCFEMILIDIICNVNPARI